MKKNTNREVGETLQLSDNEKLQIIHSLSKKQIKKWSALPREAKQQVLEGLDIATDTNWVLGLIEEAKDYE